ncbi:MAG: pyrroline-5-carboxylate reductase [Dysgonamonadaceae bacterium]|jgi:pyrroline-5-carboxylate reductase|nr:pyrroline-5-carboxylate reductase [Dysgonamonadaceae bacterium]
MNITIIGGGNMGGAIARSLSKGNIFKATDITVIDPNIAALDAIKAFNPDIHTATGDDDAIHAADIVLVAVKPHLVENLLKNIKFQLDYHRQIIISIAAGISFDQINMFLEKNASAEPILFRLVPNTAIAIGESMTFIASRNASREQEHLVADIFSSLGKTMITDERYIPAATALASCGIAYAFRYIRAAMLAGVEIGFYPEQAKNIVVQTLRGAIALIEENKSHPETEIDKVTTPDGITIKGLNVMEKYGFSNALIEGIKASNWRHLE